MGESDTDHDVKPTEEQREWTPARVADRLVSVLSLIQSPKKEDQAAGIAELAELKEKCKAVGFAEVRQILGDREAEVRRDLEVLHNSGVNYLRERVKPLAEIALRRRPLGSRGDEDIARTIGDEVLNYPRRTFDRMIDAVFQPRGQARLVHQAQGVVTGWSFESEQVK